MRGWGWERLWRARALTPFRYVIVAGTVTCGSVLILMLIKRVASLRRQPVAYVIAFDSCTVQWELFLFLPHCSVLFCSYTHTPIHMHNRPHFLNDPMLVCVPLLICKCNQFPDRVFHFSLQKRAAWEKGSSHRVANVLVVVVENPQSAHTILT